MSTTVSQSSSAEAAILALRLEFMERAEARRENEIARLREELCQHRQKQRDSETRMALLEATLNQLQPARVMWSESLWGVAAAAAILVISGVGGYLLKTAITSGG